MTLDQLRVFVAVAEREHLTQGAAAAHLTPSAATASIRALEGRHGARLFDRVGRRLALSHAGRQFLPEARAVLARAAAAELALQELSGVARGRLAVAASQTLASYWLPPLLMRFSAEHPTVALTLAEGNTTTVAAAVLAGDVDVGLIEGSVDAPALAVRAVATDRLVVVGSLRHELARCRDVPASALAHCRWVMREAGSGTRGAFEAAMRAAGVDPARLDVALVLPTNEAVCAAVGAGGCLTVVSELVARPHIEAGRLVSIDHALPERRFALLHHKERYRTKAATAFETLLDAAAKELRERRNEASYDI